VNRSVSSLVDDRAGASRPRGNRWLGFLQLGGPTIAVLVLCALWLGARGYTIWRELGAVKGQMASVEQGLRSNTVQPQLGEQLQRIGRHTDAARAAANDPLWRAVGDLPYVGRNFRVVTAIADASDSVGRRVLPALNRAAQDLQATRSGPTRHGVPLAPIEDASAQLGSAMSGIKGATATVRSSATSLVLGPVGSARADLLNLLASVQHRVSPIADTVHILPPVLGSTGARTYLVAFVNPAEARGGGGLLGAYALVRADEGRLSVVKIGSNSDLHDLERGPAGLDPDFEARYVDDGAENEWVMSNLSPHFPYTGAVWAAMYQSQAKAQVDGVISLDPAALAVLLRGSGPVAVPGGRQITASSVIDFIEHDEYALPLSIAQRKDVLQSVARASVDQLLNHPSGADASMLVPLGDAASEGHIRFMSMHSEEQQIVARYPIAGVVPKTSRPFATVFVNNAAGGKLDYYLDTGLRYAVTDCSAQHRAITITVVLHNGAPSAGLPAYVTIRADSTGIGDGLPKPVPGQNRSLLGIMLTAGARVRSATLDGRPISTTPGPGGSSTPYLRMSTERGHPVVSTFVELKPGAAANLVLGVDEPPSNEEPLLLRQPMPRPQVLESVGRCSGG